MDIKEDKKMKSIGTKEWWSAAGIRAVKTAAQAAIASIAVNTLWDIDVYAIFGIVGLAALMSVLTSLAGIPEVKTDAPEGFDRFSSESEFPEDGRAEEVK
jgi:hypothetical protein